MLTSEKHSNLELSVTITLYVVVASGVTVSVADVSPSIGVPSASH
ncbi:hypothetical protein [uncultured Croceitalea sp.]